MLNISAKETTKTTKGSIVETVLISKEKILAKQLREELILTIGV